MAIASATPQEQALAECERRYRELAASERRYRRFFEIASDWFWEVDDDYRFTYVSPNAQAALGLTLAALAGRRLSEIEGVVIPPEMATRTLAAQKAKQPYADFRYSWKLGDGRTIWISSTGTPVFAEDGAFRGYCGIARDVTAEIAAEQSLRDSEKRFRQLFEIASDYYWEVDAEFRNVYFSPNFEAAHGIPPAQLLGKRLTDTPGISVDPEKGRMVLRAQKARQPYRDFVFSRKYPDGSVRWFKVSAVPIFSDTGEFRGYRGVGANVTQGVEAEASARLAQRQLDEALAHVTQPFVLYDAEARTVAFNQAFADLHVAPNANTPVCRGVGFRDLAQWQLGCGFYAETRDTPKVDLATLLAHFESEGAHTYHLRDGRWMLVVYRRLPGGGRVGLWTDVSAVKRAEDERRALEAQLHHSQRLEALGTLAGGVAHQINNALVPIIALTKVVAAKLPPESRERRNLDAVLAAAVSSRDLVRQIVTFSRKEEDEQDGRLREAVDVAAVLRKALRLMRATLPANIQIEEEIAPVPPVLGDAHGLQQVIVNVVTNAAQAIGQAQGCVTLRLRPERDNQIRLSVADTGCGMDEPTLARIFEPFFTTRPVGEGAGLGLSVAHGIIKDHGGRIDARSAPGSGSQFDILLPAWLAAEIKDRAS